MTRKINVKRGLSKYKPSKFKIMCSIIVFLIPNTTINISIEAQFFNQQLLQIEEVKGGSFGKGSQFI